MRKITNLLGVIAVASVGLGLANAQTFDVVSVKPNSQETFGRSIKFTLTCANGRFVSRNYVVKALIGWAYTVGRDAVFKVPTWAEHEETTYNIDATSPPETSDEQCRAMLRNALAERFRLRAHTETMERFSDYVLVIDKAGIKLKPSATHGSAHITMGPGGLSARDTSMNILTAYLSEKLGAVVKNATGLETTPFDFDLDFALADPNDVDPLHAEIFEALPQQLGLRLIKKRVAESFPVVIVDQLERPSSN